jgi:hypothetical protein
MKTEKRPPQQWDSPGCCVQAQLIATFVDGKWRHVMEAGGPGMTKDDLEVPIFFCAFCGTPLNEETPVRKR